MSKCFAKIRRSTRSCRRIQKSSNSPKALNSPKVRFGTARADSSFSAIRTKQGLKKIGPREVASCGNLGQKTVRKGRNFLSKASRGQTDENLIGRVVGQW